MNQFYKNWDTNKILDRQTFLKNNNLILNGNVPNAVTSGSTGTPVRVAHSEEYIKLKQQDNARFLRDIRHDNKTLHFIFSDNIIQSNAFDIKMSIEEQIKIIKLNPRYNEVITYPTNAQIICQYCINNDFIFNNIKYFGLFGEVIEPIHKEYIHKVFPNARIWSSYSSIEFGLIAYPCPKSEEHFHLNDYRLDIEVVDEKGEECQMGEVGRIIITDKINQLSPIIRYEIGDQAVKDICPCGKVSFSKIYGKTRGFLINRAGGKSIFIDLSYKIMTIPGIIRYQVIQNSIESFDVKIISNSKVDKEISQAFNSYFGYTPNNLNIIYVEDLPLGNNGKFYASICKI